MSEKERLRALLKHWSEHSLEHREHFLEWAKKAEEINLKDVSLCLLQAAKAMEEAAKNLEKALGYL